MDIEYALAGSILNPRMAIAIEDAQGRRIMTFASYFQGSDLPAISGVGLVRCSVEPLCLGPGRYLMSISIGTKTDGLLDSLDAAAWFEIHWNNNFKNGEPYSPVYGPVLHRSDWEILVVQ